MGSEKNKKNKSKRQGLIIIIFCFFIILIIVFIKKPAGTKVIINDRAIKTEVVSSPYRQYLGLSGRESICRNCGMLFVFTDKEPRDFVMRNMRFPLDIIFIADHKIINIAENLRPEGEKPDNIYSSAAPADTVLEVPGGYCQKYNIKNGDILKYDF